MNRIIRRSNGKPVTGQRFVAADLIGLVSGVNLSSVNKVLTAINAVAQVKGIPLEELVELEAMPLTPANAERMAATALVADQLARDPAMEVYEPIVYFLDRMKKKHH